MARRVAGRLRMLLKKFEESNRTQCPWQFIEGRARGDGELVGAQVRSEGDDAGEPVGLVAQQELAIPYGNDTQPLGEVTRPTCGPCGAPPHGGGGAVPRRRAEGGGNAKRKLTRRPRALRRKLLRRLRSVPKSSGQSRSVRQSPCQSMMSQCLLSSFRRRKS